MKYFKINGQIAMLGILLICISTISRAQLAGGSYTIGSGGTYASFNAAKSAMSAGISGPVVFNVLNGTYTEQLLLSTISGVSATNTITFQSAGGDSSSVVLQYAGSSASNYVLKIDSLSYLTIRGITIKSTGGTYGRVVELANGSKYFTLKRCALITDTSLTANTITPFYTNSTRCNYATIDSCRFTGGYYGIYWYGSTANKLNRLQFSNNIIEKYCNYGGYFVYADSLTIVSNKIYNRAAASSIYYPMNIFNSNGYGLVSKNYVYCNGTGQSYGIDIQRASQTGTDPMYVTNNMVIQTNSTGTNYGMYMSYSNNINVYNNTVLMLGGSPTGGRAFYQNSTAATTGLNIKNNNFINLNGGYAYYITNPTYVTSSDYNNYYTTGTNVGYYGVVVPNLTGIQQANGMDSHSKSVNTVFTSNTDLHTSSIDLFHAGVSLASVPDDYDGELRNPTVPCIGADEYVLSSNDAGVVALIEPTNPCAAVQNLYKVSIKNYGVVNLDSVYVHWSVNSIQRNPVKVSTSILPGASLTVNLDTLTMFDGQTYNLKFWTNQPNGAQDNDFSNDTLILTGKQSSMAGIYTIGSGKDFGSFNAAVSALNSRGICAPVTFKADNGTYNEQILLGPITGASAQNTITFTSASGDSSLVKVKFNASSTANNYVLNLFGCEYVSFSKMSFIASDTSAFSRAILISDHAAHNTIENCSLSSNPVSSSYANCLYSEASCDFNVIKNNKMTGGYYSLYMYGLSSYPRSLGNMLSGNHISSYYYSAMYLTYQDSVFILNNFILSTQNNYSYGIYAPTNFRVTIAGNNIQLLNTSYGMHIYLYNCNGYVDQPNMIANNFLSKINGSTSASNGIYVSGSNYVKVLYNSVNLLDSNASSHGIYQTGGSAISILNNNVYTAVGYATYISNPTAIDTMDYNNLTTGGLYLSFWNSNQPALNNLQSASGMEQHSYSINPMFISNTNLHTNNLFLNGKAMPSMWINKDFDGENRNLTNPDIGADEFNSPANDAGIVGIISPALMVNPGISPVKVKLINGGMNNLTSVTIHWKVNNVVQTPFSWTGNLVSNAIDTNVVLGNFNFSNGTYTLKIWTSQPNGQTDGFAFNDTLSQNSLIYIPPMKGIYTLGGTNPDFPTFAAAINQLQLAGIDSNVVINVASGTYNEQISIDSVPGVSPTKTVTFKSASNDSTSVTLTYNSSASNNYVVRYNGCSYITFSKMTIIATNSTAGYAVLITNGAHHITLTNNIITSPAGTTANSVPVYLSEIAAENFNIISYNVINNGYYGIYSKGSSTVSRHYGNQYIGNELNGFYLHGIHLYYNDSVFVSKNKITGAGTTGIYGIYAWYCYNTMYINDNQVFLSGGNNQKWGIMLYYYYGSSSVSYTKAFIFNNYVSISNFNSTDFGMYIGQADNVDIINNTINVFGGNSSNSRALFIYNNCNSLTILNNNLVNTSNGTAIYLSSIAPILQCDYNNFYVNGGNIGYCNGSNFADLLQWRMYLVIDSNSVSTNPGLFSNYSYKITSTALNGTALPVSYIQKDIEGKNRNPQNPDMGAYEFSPSAKDVGVIEFALPSKNNSIAGIPTPLRMKFKNFGVDTVTSMSIGYKIDNQNAVNVAWTGVLPDNGVAEYSFPDMNLGAGDHLLKVFVVLSLDSNFTNDTLSMNYKVFPVLSVPWSDDFDGTATNFMAAGSNKLWQHGTPTASVIDTAFSIPNVWATSLSGNYLNGAMEYLYTPFYNFSSVVNAEMRFHQWYITNDNQDGMQVQVSLDSGNTWSLLGYYTDPLGTNWYNSAVGGVHSFTGNSNGWIESVYKLSTYDNFPKPIQFRFRFFSNASGTNNGFAIDNFAIETPPYAVDAKVESILSPTDSIDFASTVAVKIRVKNNGLDTLSNFPVKYKINAQNEVLDTIFQTLLPGTSTDFTFTDSIHTNISSQNFTITAFVNYAGDLQPINDSLQKNIIIRPAAWDAGIVQIIQPNDSSFGTQIQHVTVVLKNFGANSLSSCPIEYTFGSSAAVNETWTGNLSSGASANFTFSTTYPAVLGSHSLCVKTKLGNDQNSSNDQNCMNILGLPDAIVSISAIEESLQLFPNPAQNEISFRFLVEKESKAVVRCFDICGKLMEQKEIQLHAGENIINMQVSDFQQGIYIFALTSDEYSAQGRFIIER